MKFSESLETHRQSFLESMRVRGYSNATLEHYGDGLTNFFGWLVHQGIEDPREVSVARMSDYQIWLSNQPYSVRTVHSRLQSVKRFFEHLEATDRVLVNPCLKIVLPKIVDRLPKTILTPSEARAILNVPDTQTRKGIRDRAILEVFYSTGIRLGEMVRLTLYDVDYKNGFLRVNQGKFAKDRVVPMGRKACDYVREYLTKVRLEWVKKDPEVLRQERALWLLHVRPHGPIHKWVIRDMIKSYTKEAGIKRSVSPHVWRHTCATHLVANGSNIAYVQRLLGHRSLQTTQKYTRVAIPEIQATYRKTHPRAKITLGRGGPRAKKKAS